MKLALDLGTRCGWAAEIDGVVLSGTLDLKNDVQRYLRLWLWLEENVRPGDVVAYEDVKRHLGTTAAHVYGGFKAVVLSVCAKTGASCVGVPVQTIKKHATGRGNADKPAMIAAARLRGFAPLDDNEADALALLDYLSHSDTVPLRANVKRR